jgi:hypothetical protein
LGITERTVKAHVHQLYEKTGTTNRTELVTAAWSIRSGPVGREESSAERKFYYENSR